MDFKKKRWICFGAGLIIIACNGFQYGLSVFQIPLSEVFGWTIPQVAAAFSVMSVVEFFAVLFLAEKMKKALGLKKFMIAGGLLFGGGILACGFLQGSILELYLYQGVMIGIGNAVLYPGLSAYVIQIFPERSGCANGLMVAFFACGPVVWSPVSVFILEKAGSVSLSFIIVGATMTALLVFLPLALEAAPEGFADKVRAGSESEADSRIRCEGSPEGSDGESRPFDENGDKKEESAAGVRPSVFNVNKRAMLRKPEFYLFYLVFTIGILEGTMILTQGATIAEKGLGFSAAAAAAVLGGLNLGNAAGRLALGTLSDRLGIMKIVKALFVIYLACFGLLFGVEISGLAAAGPGAGAGGGAEICFSAVVYTSAMLLSMVAFGGFCALLAPTTKELFGLEFLDENFTIVYSSYALAGISAPFLVANVREATGGYGLVYVLELIFTAAGFCAATALDRRWKRAIKD